MPRWVVKPLLLVRPLLIAIGGGLAGWLSFGIVALVLLDYQYARTGYDINGAAYVLWALTCLSCFVLGAKAALSMTTGWRQRQL